MRSRPPSASRAPSISDLPRGDSESRARAISKRCTPIRPKATSARRTRSKPCTRRWSAWSTGSPVSRPACTRPRRAPMRAAEPLRAQEPLRAAEPMAHYEPAPEPHAAAPALPEQIPPRRPHPQLPRSAHAPFVHVQRTERPPIDPDLPADTPLEPGRRRARPLAGRAHRGLRGSARARARTLKREGEVTGKANFIAAARRAAQAAASEGGAVEAPQRRRAQDGRNADQPDRPLPRQPPPRADGRRQRAAGALRHHAGRRHVRRLGDGAGTAAQCAEPDPGARAAQDGGPAPRRRRAAAPAPASSAPPAAEPRTPVRQRSRWSPRPRPQA